jgi:hypothetical protein
MQSNWSIETDAQVRPCASRTRLVCAGPACVLRRCSLPGGDGQNRRTQPGLGRGRDIPEVAGQWRYMAAVMDKHSRRIVGWSLSGRRDAALTTAALRRSAKSRSISPGVLFHSDRGIEFSNFEFRAQLHRLGMVQSMNRPGKMNDNAHMESFFHSMKCEELYGKKFDTEQELRSTLSSYIRFYNERRLHSSLQYLPPAGYERRANGRNKCQLNRYKFPHKCVSALRALAPCAPVKSDVSPCHRSCHATICYSPGSRVGGRTVCLWAILCRERRSRGGQRRRRRL